MNEPLTAEELAFVREQVRRGLYPTTTLTVRTTIDRLLATLDAARPPDELRRLSEAATPGPWRWPVGGGIAGKGLSAVVFGEFRGSDAAFIVAAVNYVRSLAEPVSEGEAGT